MPTIRLTNEALEQTIREQLEVALKTMREAVEASRGVTVRVPRSFKDDLSAVIRDVFDAVQVCLIAYDEETP